MASQSIGAQVAINIFLFLLVMGMASTVDIKIMRQQLRNYKAISIGLFCQFFLMPFFGYLVTIAFNLPVPVGVTLIIVVSSPGGSYSNWWCALFNADLGLSVSMTTASTILSLGFLPMNLFIYTYAAYNSKDSEVGGESVIKSINFGVIFISIAVVIGAIATGVFCSYKFDTPRWHKIAYIGGNVSGIALIIFSTVLSFKGGSDGSEPTPQETITATRPADYVAIALPCLLGLVVATILPTLLKLSKPERLTTAVECCYQNTGIATSAALSLFSGSDLQLAMRVPTIYGFVEAISIAVYLLIFWKLGWSKAPKEEKICTIIVKTYEVQDHNEDPDKDDEGEDEVGSNIENNDEELAAESTGSNVELSAQKASTDAS
ncbi:bile acid:sodium symporter family protein [Skeletonema marinoi]|uniref:Bile acid:sodium symporter family protein n=1 Tax=Skeletonema marinoi TaxID=267567 RepID=A0AAD8XZC7_9STRA|nr:bile acid:sodium symporter family protein [Skeletonema marinoi]